jgi:hypothetical protein
MGEDKAVLAAKMMPGKYRRKKPEGDRIFKPLFQPQLLGSLLGSGTRLLREPRLKFQKNPKRCCTCKPRAGCETHSAAKRKRLILLQHRFM